MEPVSPTAIRYIKLGAGGCWDDTALDNGRLEWGLDSDPHNLMLAGDWPAVRDHYLTAGCAPSTATAYTTDAKTFYEAGEGALWITFARGRMWWGFADEGVRWTGGDGVMQATRHRVMHGGWHDRNVKGDILNFDELSTSLTRLSSYRRTSCGLTPDQQRLCLRYINAEHDREQANATAAKAELVRTLSVLIRRLSWNDFEQLVDLMLARSGWVRTSSLGGSQKDVDLIVEQPFTGERMSVQVKSRADQGVVNDYAVRLGQRSANERLMLVCHSPIGTLAPPPATNGRSIELMIGDRVTEQTIAAGLVDWIIGRS